MFDGSLGAQVGILPKGASDEAKPRWLALQPMFVQAIANAWREGEVIHIACIAADEACILWLVTEEAG